MSDFDTNVPIYLQVVNEVKVKIVSGVLKPNDKIASVREMALELGVNPNTIQRAFAELERQGLIRTERAIGRYVTDNQILISECKHQMIKDNIHHFCEYMQSLGMKKVDIIKYLDEEEDYE